MTDEFINQMMKHVVGVLCQNMGWHAAQTTSIDILADLMKRHFLHLAKSSHNYAGHYGRTQANLDDAALALRDMGINISELEEYVQNFDPVPLPYAKDVPQFPLKRESKLNFLRPGSEEVLTRPVHVHEYMPPMIFEDKVELKEEEKDLKDELPSTNDTDDANSNGDSVVNFNASQLDKEKEMVMVLEPKDKTPERDIVAEINVQKETPTSREEESSEDEIEALESKSPGSKGFVPFSQSTKTKKGTYHGENPALKRVRMMLEEEGHPLREITSVMMTTSGFLTSSREGRLPDSRPPPNREFFDPLPPPVVEKKKKVLTMKRIVEGIKKIDKEKENDSDNKDEPVLFGNPDKISKISTISALSEDKAISKLKKNKKIKTKLKLDKETMKKLAKGLEARDKKKLKIFKKSQSKLLLDKTRKKSKQMKEAKIKKRIKQEQDNLVDNLDESEEEQNFGQVSPVKISKISKLSKLPKLSLPRGERFLNPGAEDVLRQNKSLSISPIGRPKIKSLVPQGMSISPEGLIKKKRGRPRKNPIILGGPGVPIPQSALANLGRGLMDERPLKIKKSHMEPDIRSLIPDISINTPPIKPPRMQPHPQGLDMLMGLPTTPGLIPTNFILPPPPPLIKMPTLITPSIQITPATPQTPSPMVEKPKMPFGNALCSSLTITPIDMPGQKLPTRYDKTVTPGIGSPVLPSKKKDKSPTSSNLPMQIKTEPSSGITITPIVMDKERYMSDGGDLHIKGEKVSMLARLEEDMKSKEQRKKEKERRKELKKEKKKEKKSKERDRGDGKEKKRDKSEKKKKKMELLEAELGAGVGLPAVPKLTLKLSGHSNSGTPTPVDSPNPPQVFVGEVSPPLQKKIIIKPIEEGRKRTPSPELARFSPLVTRPPKPSRAAKVHASAALAADAMGASIAEQMASFPQMGSGLNTSRGAGAGAGGRGRGRVNKSGGSTGPPEVPVKLEKPLKSKGAQGGLVTETVGCIMDEQGNKIWICPQCGRQDDGSPMIGCDKCDDWYHFTCMGIMVTPEEDTEWYCPRCRKKTKKDKK